MNVLHKYCLLSFGVFLSAHPCFAQAKTDAFVKKNEMNLAVNYSQILSVYTPCFQVEFNHIYKDRYTMGLYFNGGSTTTKDTFGYNVESPVVGYISIGWQNGIKLLKKNRFTISSSLSNNLSLITLGDNADQSTSFNGIVLLTTSKEVKTSYCYSILPKLEITYNIWSTLNFYSGVGYLFNVGTTFTDIKSFNGPNINIGLQFQLD